MCVCRIVGGVLRLGIGVAIVLALVGGLAELTLLAAGVKPVRGVVGPSNVVPDRWTGFRLRPNVMGEEPFITNDLGMHAPRPYALEPPPGSLRVAILGSSVVYGLNVSFADTIPGVVERALVAAGHPSEVLNFGTHGHNIVHLSALLQAYVHQLQPDIVVVVMDIQVGLPRWPAVQAGPTAEDTIAELEWWEALVKRGSDRSILLSHLDDPRPARRWIRRTTGLPLQPWLRGPRPKTDEAPAAEPVADTPTVPLQRPPDGLRAYEDKRERELAAPLAAMAAFCAARGIALYVTTPYGPYFDITEDELARMSVHHFIEEATRIHGSDLRALGAEVELITRVVHGVAAGGSVHVIDMLDVSRRVSLRTSPDFTDDGLHLSPAGNATFGTLIASRIVDDLQARPADPH